MKRYKPILVGVLLLALWIILGGGITFYVDAIWFDSLGYYSVFRSIIWSRFVYWLIGFLGSFLVLGLSFWLSSRHTYEQDIWLQQQYVVFGNAQKRRGLFWNGLLVLSALLGFLVQTRWLTFLRLRHQASGGGADPIFGKELSFYFFRLPVWDFIVNFLLALVVLSLLLAAVSYVLHGHLGYSRRLQMTYASQLHLAALMGLGLCLVGARFWLNRYHLLFTMREKGVTFGAGYTDIHARLPIYWILLAATLIVAVLFFIAPLLRTLKYAAGGVAGFVALYVLAGIYPGIIQNFVVEPNELQKESSYLRYHIQATLRAYNLDTIEVSDFSNIGRLNPAALKRNEGTLRNIRLWDWRPLKDAYDQLQSIRPYYSFEDVDLDRYVIQGDYRQIMLSVRELDFGEISAQAQTWINQYFQYTHGYGLCASPVNEVTAEGLPEFFLKDIPPRSTVDLSVTRPEIYFGEKTDYPVFVRTRMKEFDYPVGDQNSFTTYEANRGLPIGSLFTRLVYAWELGSFQILFTENFTSDSRVLLHRAIGDRIRKIAPFLDYDNDPYIVVDEGRLFWIQDAYTTSTRYPYAEPFDRRFNYIRNSVKVVVDAHLGDVFFYISDPEDPLIRTYRSVFPSLFRPLSEMRPGLRRHIRYPEDMFGVQRTMYCTYHMRDPRVFYNKEDLWQVPHEIYRGGEQSMDSYHTIMTLPGHGTEEFILLIPFTPKNKNNMIAWLAARSDSPNYGKLVLYQFPKQQLTYGPLQIEARIDQDPTISELITLWSQKGSRVIRGNLLVIPIENSVLYIEPLYLQAEKSQIPELTRVIAVYENRVVVAETLKQALEAVIKGLPPRPEPPAETAPSETTGLRPEIATLVGEAIRHFDLSQELLKTGDWTGYGDAQRKLRQILEELAKTTSESPPPTPAAQ